MFKLYSGTIEKDHNENFTNICKRLYFRVTKYAKQGLCEKPGSFSKFMSDVSNAIKENGSYTNTELDYTICYED